jgi:hypothetical protein
MSEDLKSLVSLITTMHTEQSQASQRTDEHLSHLRDTMHKLANDMVGVSQLTGIMHKEVSELKKKQSDDISAVHGHIDRETKDLSLKLDTLENKINVIAPKAESFGKLADNVMRAVTVVVVGLIVSAIAFFASKPH